MIYKALQHARTAPTDSITVVLVLITELLNSGIEAVVDRVSMEHHHLSKMAKDYGSAAVHLSLLLCLGVWVAAIVHRWGH